MVRPSKIAAGLLALGLLVGWTSNTTAAAVPPLNAGVLWFARANLGKKVGNGECWTLAAQALTYSGARIPGRKGTPTYVFGKRVALGRVVPGDVLQFEKVVFERRTPNGGFSKTTFPHHTAIVTTVRGREITLIHQNWNHVKRVTTTTINLDHRKGGSLKAYRPQR